MTMIAPQKLLLAALVASFALSAATAATGRSANGDPFPACSPPPVRGSVSLVLKGPCKLVSGHIYRYLLVLRNGTGRKLSTARMVFARKSFIVKVGVPYKDENPANPDGRVDWAFTNIPPAASRTVSIWLRFKKVVSGQTVTGYILWLQAKPVGERAISRTWYPTLRFR